jgi:DNA-3-methyladenine glycosylase
MYEQRFLREFFLQDTFKVAKMLLGAYLCTNIGGNLTCGMIVETEAYIGGEDKASHSYKGRRTQRTEIQFGLGGYAYTFLIYGKYTQFCVVTGTTQISDVVLIRALEPVEGIEIMSKRRNTNNLLNMTNGPGKLCDALGITTQFYGEDLWGERIWISPPKKSAEGFETISAKRVGINYAEEYADKLWRYYIQSNPYVSR